MFLRLFLLIIFLGTSFSVFASNATFSENERYSYKTADIDFYADNSPFVNILSLKTENFQPQYNRLKPKLDDILNQSKNAISILEQSKVAFIYLKYSRTISLNLASFSISFPFHSFP